MPVRLVTLLALLALAGCGSAGAPVRTSSTAVTVTLDDYTIRPQALHVPAGARLRVTVRNTGRLAHTFRIRARTRNVLSFTAIRPGKSKTRSVKLGKGTYITYCVLANHEELGMNGTLTAE